MILKTIKYLPFCLIVAWLAAVPVRVQSVTFYNDVQPIIHNNCSVCHRPGEAAPFSLITYEDVVKRSKFIRKVVSARYMPPWKVGDYFVDFANDRSLNEKEIRTIVAWIDAGTPKGKGLFQPILQHHHPLVALLPALQKLLGRRRDR